MNPVLPAAAGVAIGTLVGHGHPRVAWPCAAIAVACLAMTALKRAEPTHAMVCVLIALTAGAGASASWRSAEDGLLPTWARDGEFVRVCGSVRSLRPRSLEIRADRVALRNRSWHTSEPLRVTGRSVKPILPGSGVCGSGVLRPARPGRNEAPLLLADELHRRGTGSRLRLIAAHVRERFARAAVGALPQRQAGLLLGMTDGDVRLIDESTTEDFRTTGLAHIVAVSGYNVAVFLAVVMLLARMLIPRRRWLRVVVALPALVMFAFLTGLEPSVLRATVSAGVVLVAVAGGRPTDALRSVAFAFIVLLLASPEMLFDPGFQLSFGATLGIVVWGQPLSERIARLLAPWHSRLAKATAAGVGTTVAAQIAVAPLLAWHFGRIPGVGGFANVVAIPLGGLVMVGGMITLSAACLVPFLAWAPVTMRLPLDSILWSAHAFSRLPAASIGVSAIAAVALTAGLAAIAARPGRVRLATFVVFVSCGAIAGGQSIAAGTTACTGAGVYALDVGQGTAVLLRDGAHAVLVDAGPARGNVVGRLQDLGVRHLDALFVSHAHVDHALGAVDILERLDVDRVLGPVTLRWGSGGDVIRTAARQQVPYASVAAGDRLLAGSIGIDVLWPDPGPAPPFAEDLVDPHSLVLRAELGGFTVLLPGDIRSEQQKVLVGPGVAAPVAVAVHHGSKNLDADFVNAVGARLTLITVGSPNPFGLPAPEAVRAYARHGRVFRTDQDGTVRVCLSSGRAEVVTQK